MADMDKTPNGRLGSLAIAGFRGIDQLCIPRLGRVTLVAGRNGVGKTTVLDALRVYAARGRIEALRELLLRREELTTVLDEDGEERQTVALGRLFHRNGGASAGIAIGPVDGKLQLTIEDVEEHPSVPDDLLEVIKDEEVSVLRIAFDTSTAFLPWPDAAASRRTMRRLTRDQGGFAPSVNCESLGPGLLANTDLARLWDEVALTDDEALALDGLRLVFGDQVERAAVVGEPPTSPFVMENRRLVRGRTGRRVVVKLTGRPQPLPLKSLGDGATRMFAVALALANCRNGILLMDEAENGIHYSLQNKFWQMVFRAAEDHNTQVVATTHSKDCVNGFAEAAKACKDVQGNLIRIERCDGEMQVIDYSKDELEVAAEQNIEVR